MEVSNKESRKKERKNKGVRKKTKNVKVATYVRYGICENLLANFFWQLTSITGVGKLFPILDICSNGLFCPYFFFRSDDGGGAGSNPSA